MIETDTVDKCAKMRQPIWEAQKSKIKNTAFRNLIEVKSMELKV